MRATTALNRLLRLQGASVIDVRFGAERVIVTVRLRRGRRVCSTCGQVAAPSTAARQALAHLDLGAHRS